MRARLDRRRIPMALSLLTVSLAILVGGSHARAEGPEPLGPVGWRFDVRVVRVSTDAAKIEQAPRLPATSPAGVSTAPWADLLAALQARGTALIVTDRSATGVIGRELSLVQRETATAIVVRRSDAGGAQSESVPFMTGAEARLLAATLAQGDPRSLLTYKVNVDWLKPPSPSGAPLVVTTVWQGDLVVGGAGTLVLRHAEQEPASTTGTEIYVLISWASL